MSKRFAVLILSTAALISAAAYGAQQFALERYDLNLAIVEWLWVQLAAGWLFLFAGLATARSRPEMPMGNWMIALAMIWLTRLIFTPPLIQWESIGAALAFYGILFVILYTYPDGRLDRRERWVTAGFLLLVAAVAYVDVALEDYYGWVRDDHPTCCPSHLLLIDDSPDVRRTLLSWAAVATAIIFIAITTRFLVRWMRSSSVGRKGLGRLGFLLPIMVVLVLIPGASALGSGFTEAPFADTASSRPALYIQNGALVLFAGFMAASLIGARMSRARVADLLEGLAEPMTPDLLQQRMRDALGDQDARLGFRLGVSDEFVGVDGRQIDVERSSDLEVTDLGDEATIVHDPALDRGLVRSVGAAAHLALENARLQAELKAQLEEVLRSRVRLVAATDEARRAVERDLHDGAQQRLVTLAATLRQAQRTADQANPALEALLAVATDEAGLAIDDLRNLARGVHPAILNQAGLGPAIDTLADRSSIPVTTDVTDRRFETAIETTAYFVVAEALTNANKHSGADHVVVSAKLESDYLVVEVSDDGRGQANWDGSGLSGLRDRLEALGGSIELASSPEMGTRLRARIPTSGKTTG